MYPGQQGQFGWKTRMRSVNGGRWDGKTDVRRQQGPRRCGPGHVVAQG
jgi:hypothetical protein